jgi:putative phosphoribosyl transferase
MGAIASGGIRVVSDDIVAMLAISPAAIDEAAAREQTELARREQLYRGSRPFPDLEARTVIVIDDGLATGASMEAAIVALRQRKPARIVVAVPVGAPETCQRLAAVADDVVCASTPEPFQAVGLWYDEFDQTSDEEVIDLLQRGGL